VWSTPRTLIVPERVTLTVYTEKSVVQWRGSSPSPRDQPLPPDGAAHFCERSSRQGRLIALLIDDGAGRFPFEATGGERHDRRFDGVLHRARRFTVTRRCDHRLMDILVIAVIAVIVIPA
jgi:hypothetical protein